MNSSSGIYVLRENLIQFYKRQEFLLRSVFRFVVCLAVLLLLRSHLGIHIPGGSALNSTLLNVIIALICSMLPPGFSAGIIGLILLLDLYKLSLEAAAVGAAMILVCLLVYFRFTPRDTMILLAMPVAYAVNLHFLVPIIAGLIFGPGAAVPVVFGLLFTRYVLLVEGNLSSLVVPEGGMSMVGERLIANFRSLVDGMVNDRLMIGLAAAFVITVILVCFIRRLAIENAWTIAITAGCILELAVLLLGDMMFEIGIDLAYVFVGIVFSFLLAQIVRFFIFNVDYLRIENVQFEDEDYYYYVKAIPKVMVYTSDLEEDEFNPPEGEAVIDVNEG
jgi:hypothetical protein